MLASRLQVQSSLTTASDNGKKHGAGHRQRLDAIEELSEQQQFLVSADYGSNEIICDQFVEAIIEAGVTCGQAQPFLKLLQTIDPQWLLVPSTSQGFDCLTNRSHEHIPSTRHSEEEDHSRPPRQGEPC